jgi:hypothetical protein
VDGVFVGAAALACPIGMGLMMWFMGKGMRKEKEPDARAGSDVETLREEHRRLGERIEQLDSRGAERDARVG